MQEIVDVDQTDFKVLLFAIIKLILILDECLTQGVEWITVDFYDRMLSRDPVYLTHSGEIINIGFRDVIMEKRTPKKQ